MAEYELDAQLDDEILELWFKGGNLVYNKKFQEAKELMEKTWEMFPDPKEKYSHSFHVTENLTKALIGLEQYEAATEWLQIHKTTGEGRIDGGEKDFLEGELLYAQQEIEKASFCFEIANKKSGGRLFKQKDRLHYKELLSKASIRPEKLKEILKVSKKEIKSGNFSEALSLLYDAFNLNVMHVEVNFLKGLCHFELEELDDAAESLTRAYMLDGEKIFGKHDPKYIEFLKTRIKLK